VLSACRKKVVWVDMQAKDVELELVLELGEDVCGSCAVRVSVADDV
jgi:hypothetical protein